MTKRLAFRPKGVLREDFDEMFSDVITSLPTLTEAVLRTLLDNACTVTEIAEMLGMEKNGHISSVLLQLEEAGMVSADEGRNPSSGKQMREKHYRLRDNYVRFYLKYIEPVKNTIDAVIGNNKCETTFLRRATVCWLNNAGQLRDEKKRLFSSVVPVVPKSKKARAS